MTSKVHLLNVYGFSNRGDLELLAVALKQIRKRLGEDTQISISCFEDSARCKQVIGDRAEFFERIGNRPRSAPALLGYFYQVAIGIVSFAPCFIARIAIPILLTSSQRKTLAALEDSRIVISAPGGYLQDSNYAFLLALLNIRIAKVFGKPVILANQSIGPIRNPIGRVVTRKVLRDADRIIAREEFSYLFCQELLRPHNSNLSRGGDLAFWSPEIEKTHGQVILKTFGVELNNRVLGITVVDWNFPSSHSPTSKRKLYINLLAEACFRAYLDHGMTIFIFNQVSADHPSREDLTRRLKELGCPHIVDTSDRSADELRSMISNCSMFLGSRFHSCIFALTAGIPTFAIAYLPKTEYILKDMGLSQFSVSIDRIDCSDFLERFSEFLKAGDTLRTHYTEAVRTYRTRFSSLEEFLNN